MPIMPPFIIPEGNSGESPNTESKEILTCNVTPPINGKGMSGYLESMNNDNSNYEEISNFITCYVSPAINGAGVTGYLDVIKDSSFSVPQNFPKDPAVDDAILENEVLECDQNEALTCYVAPPLNGMGLTGYLDSIKNRPAFSIDHIIQTTLKTQNENSLSLDSSLLEEIPSNCVVEKSPKGPSLKSYLDTSLYEEDNGETSETRNCYVAPPINGQGLKGYLEDINIAEPLSMDFSSYTNDLKSNPVSGFPFDENENNYETGATFNNYLDNLDSSKGSGEQSTSASTRSGLKNVKYSTDSNKLPYSFPIRSQISTTTHIEDSKETIVEQSKFSEGEVVENSEPGAQTYEPKLGTNSNISPPSAPYLDYLTSEYVEKLRVPENSAVYTLAAILSSTPETQPANIHAFMDNESLNDIKLRGTDGKTIYGNKKYLALKSVVLAKMFNDLVDQDYALIDIGFHSSILRAVVAFCYTERIEGLISMKMTVEDARNAVIIAEAADYFELYHLRDIMENYVQATVEKVPSLTCAIFDESLGKIMKNEVIIETCLDRIRIDPIKTLFPSDEVPGKGVLDLGFIPIKHVIKDSRINATEFTIFNALHEWIHGGHTEEDGFARRLRGIEVARDINLSRISSKDLSESVEKSGLFTTQKIKKAFQAQTIVSNQCKQLYHEIMSMTRSSYPNSLSAEVVGAGSIEVNGDYYISGLFNDAPMYQKQGTWNGKDVIFSIVRGSSEDESEEEKAMWGIVIYDKDPDEYSTDESMGFYCSPVVSGDSLDLPGNGWEVIGFLTGKGPLAPAPIIVN
eukprot:CAMPEP_0184869302 /NCGR_PEP_ID=MMETSP0580-20130426/33567_1 /TAXON_ID=1118495 /ORGANISM="Dactyliosolen fragilissimus" /LENGTH=798 /DNA_ID=CAMNT_0027370695 /DNA_START=62 /DNA_END=2458 /DNA_ORIENTATION=+